MSDFMANAGGAEPPAPGPVVGFLEDFLTGLVGALEATLGEDGARAFVAAAAEAVRTRHSAGNGDLPDALTETMVRIGGGFRVAEVSADRVVLVNARCPFGAGVEGKVSHCAMTQTLLGRAAAERRGYASVEMSETIAKGDGRCVIVVHLARGKPGRAFRG